LDVFLVTVFSSIPSRTTILAHPFIQQGNEG
jgi:hypothetical protein